MENGSKPKRQLVKKTVRKAENVQFAAVRKQGTFRRPDTASVNGKQLKKQPFLQKVAKKEFALPAAKLKLRLLTELRLILIIPMNTVLQTSLS